MWYVLGFVVLVNNSPKKASWLVILLFLLETRCDTNTQYRYKLALLFFFC
jgi:hypothetical protein